MSELFVDSVNHWFGENEILSSVYINCKVGEVVGLLGRNGSGKSTLLKIIFGSIKPKFKYLKIDDKLYHQGFLSHNLVYLPQDHFIPKHLKIADAISIFCTVHGDKVLGIEFITKHLHSKFSELSGGERRFIECLLLIYADARYVLLDEPFSQLAPLWVELLKKHMRTARQYKGFIVTDHMYKSILEVADRVVLLHNRCNYIINNEDDLVTHGYLLGITH